MLAAFHEKHNDREFPSPLPVEDPLIFPPGVPHRSRKSKMSPLRHDHEERKEEQKKEEEKK